MAQDRNPYRCVHNHYCEEQYDGKNCPYDKDNFGGSDNGDKLLKAVNEYKSNDLKSEVNSTQKKIKQLEAFDDKNKSVQQIIDQTGYTKEQAEKVYDTIKYYTSAGYGEIRKNKESENAKIIEDFIEKHPKFDGTIYRGVGFENQKGKEYLNYLKQKQNNRSPINMGGISSWSSEESIAQDFADNRKKANDSYRFIFETDNKSGVGIDHLSNWVGESEVLHSSKTKYKVKEVLEIEKGNSPLYKIIVEEV